MCAWSALVIVCHIFSRCLDTICSTPYATHHTQQTICNTPYAAHHMQHTIRSTPYAVHHMQYTICSTPYAVHHMQYTICNTPYAAHHMQHTICSTPYVVHHMQHTIRCKPCVAAHRIQHAMCSTSYVTHYSIIQIPGITPSDAFGTSVGIAARSNSVDYYVTLSAQLVYTEGQCSVLSVTNVHCGDKLRSNGSGHNFHRFTVHLDFITSFVYPTECTTGLL